MSIVTELFDKVPSIGSKFDYEALEAALKYKAILEYMMWNMDTSLFSQNAIGFLGIACKEGNVAMFQHLIKEKGEEEGERVALVQQALDNTNVDTKINMLSKLQEHFGRSVLTGDGNKENRKNLLQEVCASAEMGSNLIKLATLFGNETEEKEEKLCARYGIILSAKEQVACLVSAKGAEALTREWFTQCELKGVDKLKILRDAFTKCIDKRTMFAISFKIKNLLEISDSVFKSFLCEPALQQPEWFSFYTVTPLVFLAWRDCGSGFDCGMPELNKYITQQDIAAAGIIGIKSSHGDAERNKSFKAITDDRLRCLLGKLESAAPLNPLDSDAGESPILGIEGNRAGGLHSGAQTKHHTP